MWVTVDPLYVNVAYWKGWGDAQDQFMVWL